MNLDNAEVVIVGGGVSGLSSGWWLSRAGVDVVVVDKGVIGYEASSRNGGQMGHRGKERADGLAKAEVELWPQLDDLLGYPTEWKPGLVRIALLEYEMVEMEQHVEAQRSLGAEAHIVDLDTIREWIPTVSERALGGLFAPSGGHANPQRTVQAYAWAMQDHGGRILQNCTVTGFKVEGERITEVETDRGTIGCDFVVSAAGPQTGHIAEMAGVWVPVAPGRVEILVTAPIEPMWDGFVFGNGLYGRQTRRGNLAYGGGNQEWIDVELASPEKPNTPLIRNVGRRLAELMPAVEHVPVIRTWAGVVEQTPDYSPIIDIADHPTNFLVCTLSADGFGLSPATGKAVSELVLHGESTIPTDHMNGFWADSRMCPARGWREDRGWTPAQDRT